MDPLAGGSCAIECVPKTTTRRARVATSLCCRLAATPLLRAICVRNGCAIPSGNPWELSENSVGSLRRNQMGDVEHQSGKTGESTDPRTPVLGVRTIVRYFRYNACTCFRVCTLSTARFFHSCLRASRPGHITVTLSTLSATPRPKVNVSSLWLR